MGPNVKPMDLVAIDMGYGHLRPAHALAEFVGLPVLEADQEPLADPVEQGQWDAVRRVYESISRASQMPLVGGPLRDVLEAVTAIPPLYPLRDLSSPTVPVRLFKAMAARGLGRGLAQRLRERSAALLTTFYAPAVLSDYHGVNDVYCVVTDTDINRIWAPFEPHSTSVNYFVPSRRTERRLKAYGVAPERVAITGFPLPHELLGGPELSVLRRHLARRLVVLDPNGTFRAQYRDEVSHFLGELPEPADVGPPHLVFAVGGAGAQAEMAFQFLPSLAARIRHQRVRLSLIAGIRPEVAEIFEQAIERSDLRAAREAGDIRIQLARDHTTYFREFNAILAEADILWTKPSELTFFAGLALPLIFSWPVGVHERHNRRWAIEAGAGIKQREPSHVGEWLWDLLSDGTLAGAAWSGFMRLPKFGLYQIVETVLGPERLETLLKSSAVPAEPTSLRAAPAS